MSTANNKELHQAQKQIEELMHVNSQWDLEYREQEEAFRRYRLDSQHAQSESQTFIAKLKEEKEQLYEEVKTLKYELERSHRQLRSMSERIKALERSGASTAGGGGGLNSVSVQRLKELEEESTLLRQQLKTYQEDFEAERRDRERMSEEKQSAALKYEAEITSLRLQLDRCRNELSHYTAETNRLAQQLRLKYEYEQDQYKKHLESRGYIPRSPSGKLPPLDPFVENDPPAVHQRPPPSASQVPTVATHQNGYPQARRDNGPSYGVSVLSRGSYQQQTSSAPTTSDQLVKPPSPSERRSHTPSPTHTNGYGRNVSATKNGYIMQNGQHVTNSAQQQNGYHQPQPYVNGYGLGRNAVVDSDGVNEVQGKFQELAVASRDGNFGGVQYSPVESKGRYQCPRCARRFTKSADCIDHKARCIS